MKKWKLFLIPMVLVFSMMLTSCGEKKGKVEDKKADTKLTTVIEKAKGKVGLSISTLNNPFFVTLADSAKEAAKESGIDLIIVNASDDTSKQSNDIEDLLVRDVKVLIVNPVDSDAVAPAVKEAIKKGVKVISVDRAVNGVDVNVAIASDNVAGAKMATEYLIKTIGDGKEVARLEGIPGASATNDRGKGFNEAVKGKEKVVAVQTANFNRAQGMTVTENILQSYPNIAGIFADNDEMALGAIEAIAAAKKDIKVVGFDAIKDAKKAVKDGKMLATVEQKPGLMGEKAVDCAAKLLNDKKVEKVIPVEVKLLTK